MSRFPQLRLSLLQCSPEQAAEMVSNGQADLAIAGEILSDFDDLRTLPCYQWNYLVVTLPNHPLLNLEVLSLEEIARYPIITYDSTLSGRSKIDSAFARRNIKPDIVIEAIDSDIIKTYDELGVGIGLVSELAFKSEHDTALRALTARHLFETNVAKIAVKQGAYLRSFVYTFIELLAPNLNRSLIEQALSGSNEHYDL